LANKSEMRILSRVDLESAFFSLLDMDRALICQDLSTFPIGDFRY
jgi:hypothetical protein